MTEYLHDDSADRDARFRQANLLGHTTSLTGEFIRSHGAAVGYTDIPDIIKTIYAALAAAGQPEIPAAPPAPKLTAADIRDAVQPDSIMCFEDGKRYKSMKRHLRVYFNLTPDEYRAKWGLPASFPMVAPNYSAHRSELAKANGLGRK